MVSTREVVIHARGVKGKKVVVLWATGMRIARVRVDCDYGVELERSYQKYIEVIEESGRHVSIERPNLFRAFIDSRPARPLLQEVTYSGGAEIRIPLMYKQRKPRKPKEREFEVNLAQALVGWKSWEVSEEGTLETANSLLWKPGVATKALCRLKEEQDQCKKVPGEHDSCGIYASDDPEPARGYHEVLGEVYGWGRYIRGETGWRAQFAYPKCFYLDKEQGHLLEILKPFGVPIHQDVAMQVYFPEEDGFDEYRQDTPEGSCRTDEVSCATKNIVSWEDPEDDCDADD